MIQVALILIGLFILIKGNLKVSDNKEIVRPQSIYWGLIIIIYGIVCGFLPTTQIIYGLIFWISLLLISIIFVMKGKMITSSEAVIKSTDTKRNLIILLIFIGIVAAVSYFFLK